jgi:hypothetical protein
MAADPVTPATDLLGSLAGLMGTNTAKGATLGALMSKLLSSIEAPGGVNKGVDMSKVGNIAPRTTQIPTGRYIPYAEYGARDTQPAITPELARALGIPMGMGAQPPLSQYTARPQMDVNAQQKSITSAGTGLNTQLNPTITPRGSNTIDPLTGALLGASLGYIMPESQAYTSSGATQSGINALQNFGKSGVDAFGGLLKSVPGLSSAGKAISDWANSNNYNYLNNYGSTYSQPANPDTGIYNYPVYKDGGMAAPLMAADGGEVQQPSYYTFGQVVNPADILNQMAQGGQPKQGGLHVPTVEGRHDYRNGSRVTGEGDGQSDDIPAMLADGEYVFDADTVAQLGNGSTKAGSDLLDKFREEIRSHKRSAPVNKIPPPAKSPLAYMAAAQKKVRG